jgi:hypothetical protein
MKRRLGAASVLGLLAMVACGKTTFTTPLPPGEVADDFSQVTVGVVDILWVIDDSGSMADKQQNVHDNLNSFFHYLQDAQVDYHVAVTTTDTTAGNAGQLVPVGNPTIITSATPNALATFQNLVEVGTMGNALDKELDAARLVLMVNPPGFLRPQAYLFIVWVSDQDDQSFPGDPTFFYRTFKSFKGLGNDGMVNAGAITGDLPDAGNPMGGCFTPGNGEAPAGLRVGSVVQMMSGTLGSICSASFADVLDALGVAAVGLQRRFKLSNTPDVSTIKVNLTYPCTTTTSTVQPLCTGSLTSTCSSPAGGYKCALKKDPTPPTGAGWEYDVTNNEIVFDTTAIPPKGTTIEVLYYKQGDAPH